MAQIQDKIGLEVEESIGALVGDVFQSETKPVNAKQLIDEISSLKQQVRLPTQQHIQIHIVYSTCGHVYSVVDMHIRRARE